jgi:hypothetical protein
MKWVFGEKATTFMLHRMPNFPQRITTIKAMRDVPYPGIIGRPGVGLALVLLSELVHKHRLVRGSVDPEAWPSPPPPKKKKT